MDTHAQHDWFLFLLVNGLVGAVNPGVCAQVPEAHVRVPGNRFVLFVIFANSTRLCVAIKTQLNSSQLQQTLQFKPAIRKHYSRFPQRADVSDEPVVFCRTLECLQHCCL